MATISLNDGVRTLAITSTTPCGATDLTALLTALAAVDYLSPGVALSGGILTITLSDGRVLSIVLSGTSLRIQGGATNALSYTFTAAGAGNGVYTGTVSVTANSLVGRVGTVAGFVTGANNGVFLVTANNGSTTITTNNSLSEAETHAGTMTLTLASDLWQIQDLQKVLAFAHAVAATVKAYTATVFTVVYA